MDTIAAIGTPHGKGGVAMVRISGDTAFDVAERIFAPAAPERFAKKEQSRAYYGSFRDENGIFDDGLCLVFRAPHSFTGENVAELYCHGGLLVTQKLLEAALKAGARLARPGEFTRRAFIGGRISLTQAEAIGGLIEAKSEKYLRVSARQASGTLAAALAGYYETLRGIAASVYAFIDYPDEDMTDIPVPEMRKRIDSVREGLLRLSRTHEYGTAISEGIKTALIGKPNTGKSSVLNMLCGSDRAIVTDIAGTTRDVITETVKCGDVLLRLSDTAGIRDGADDIERIGVEKSLECIGEAELIFAVFDLSRPLDGGDFALIEEIKRRGKADRVICLMNKSDIDSGSVKPPFEKAVRISALCGEGREDIAAAVAEMFGGADIGENEEIITNARQNAAIVNAAAALADAAAALDGFTQDIAGMDIERAMGYLGEADGRTVGEDIVNEIFSHFCVGK